MDLTFFLSLKKVLYRIIKLWIFWDGFWQRFPLPFSATKRSARIQESAQTSRASTPYKESDDQMVPIGVALSPQECDCCAREESQTTPLLGHAKNTTRRRGNIRDEENIEEENLETTQRRGGWCSPCDVFMVGMSVGSLLIMIWCQLAVSGLTMSDNIVQAQISFHITPGMTPQLVSLQANYDISEAERRKLTDCATLEVRFFLSFAIPLLTLQRIPPIDHAVDCTAFGWMIMQAHGHCVIATRKGWSVLSELVFAQLLFALCINASLEHSYKRTLPSFPSFFKENFDLFCHPSASN